MRYILTVSRDAPGVANAKLKGSVKTSSDAATSAEIQGDRIWAVRFAKVHKGLLRSRWRQTEAVIGAALDGNGEEEEKIDDVLKHEGIAYSKMTEVATDRGQFVFVTGVNSRSKE